LTENEKRAGEAREGKAATSARTGVAALRERRDEKRRGNDAPWKAWKTPKAKNEFPTLSTGLGNPAKNQDAGFPHFHRADGGSISTRKDKNETAIRFQLTDPGHFKHHNNASVAALRS